MFDKFELVFHVVEAACHVYYVTLIVPMLHFITARKRSLGQGNVFTPVCHSVHRGRVSVWVISVQGGLCPGGSLSRWVSVQEDLCLGGLCSGSPCHRDPPYGKEQVVGILLECILVLNCHLSTCVEL